MPPLWFATSALCAGLPSGNQPLHWGMDCLTWKSSSVSQAAYISDLRTLELVSSKLSALRKLCVNAGANCVVFPRWSRQGKSTTVSRLEKIGVIVTHVLGLVIGVMDGYFEGLRGTQ